MILTKENTQYISLRLNVREDNGQLPVACFQ